MKYAIGFLLVSVSTVGMLHGMGSLRGGKMKQNHATHSYYFHQLVTALEQRDQKRVELYCNLDPKLVPEIEKTLAQNAEQTKWSMDVIGDVKIRARL